MHKYVRMTVSFLTLILQRGDIFVFTFSLERITDEVDHPCCISYQGEFLGVLSSNFTIFQSMIRSSTRE